MSFPIQISQEITRKELLRKFVDIQYERNENEFNRGTFRVRGDIIDIFPSYEDYAYRIKINQRTIEKILLVDPLRGTTFDSFDRILIYPKTFFSTPHSILEYATEGIERELKEQVDSFKKQGKILEANRIEKRTLFDLEMLSEFGWCPGIENYSLYLSQREPGDPPFTLLDYFPSNFIIIIDESHVTIPQLRGMYYGNRSRKQTLIEHNPSTSLCVSCFLLVYFYQLSFLFFKVLTAFLIFSWSGFISSDFSHTRKASSHSPSLK